MKKTAQTLLTAAIFATALGSSAPSQFRQPALAVGDPIEEVETNLVDIYGPPSMFTTEAPEESTTTKKTRRTKTTETSTDTTYTTTTEDIPAPLYGPPWVFYPTGDANMDNVTDARDLTLIKQLALGSRNPGGSDAFFIADVDHDNDVDADDVHLFMEEVLGIPKKEESAVTTTAPDTTTVVTTTASQTDEAFISDLLDFTNTGVIALYGPPRTGDWEMIRNPADPESALSSFSEKNGQKDKSSKTETVAEANEDSAS